MSLFYTLKESNVSSLTFSTLYLDLDELKFLLQMKRLIGRTDSRNFDLRPTHSH